MFDPEKHRRRSVRLRSYDYSNNGAYFVTICSHKKECIFGDVIDGKVQLSEYGRIVEREWDQTQDLRQNVQVDEFLVMPNHFHGILLIDDNDHVGARRCLAQDERANNRAKHGEKENRATHRVAPTGIVSGSVGAIIGQFKSVATKQINRLRNTPGRPVWQRNYYEHIIRNDEELNRIQHYIIENPLKWEEDPENPNQ